MNRIMILALVPLIALAIAVAAMIGGATTQPVSAATSSPQNQLLLESPDGSASACLGAQHDFSRRFDYHPQYNSLGELLGWNVEVWQIVVWTDAFGNHCNTQEYMTRSYWVPYVGV